MQRIPSSEQIRKELDDLLENGRAGLEYVFVDAVYKGLRRWGCSQGLLYAWAICRNGHKVMLHLALGRRESYDNCLAFLRDKVRRGLRTPMALRA
jgi:transposase-like protein